MRNIILFRDDSDWQDEKEYAEKYFETTRSRMTIKSGDLVIPRFSALARSTPLANPTWRASTA